MSDDKEEMIRGDDGRTYRRNADGRLSEVFDPKVHAQRLLDSITDQHVITGVRISDSSNPDNPAVVVTFEPEESAKILEAVREILQDRAA